jgi:hypothetical protein
VWAEEFVVMYEKFVGAGCDVDVATPAGVTPTIDPHSLNPKVVGTAQAAHLGLRDAIHVGHSTGGGEALQYAARHGGGRVARLGKWCKCM